MARHTKRCVRRLDQKSAPVVSSDDSSVHIDGLSGSSEDEPSVATSWKSLHGYYPQLRGDCGKKTGHDEATAILRSAERYLAYGKRHPKLISPDDGDAILQTLNHCDLCCLSFPLFLKFISEELVSLKAGSKRSYCFRLRRLIRWRLGSCKSLSLLQSRLQVAFSMVLTKVSDLIATLSKVNKVRQCLSI